MTQCVIDARDAEHGYLCAGCFTRLSSMLRDIEDQAAVLSAVPSLQQRAGSGGGSLKSERAPALLDVLVHTDRRRNVFPYAKPPLGPACHDCWHETCMLIRNYDDAYNAGAVANMSVLNTLHSWARAVREDPERKLATPERVTVAGERDLLTRQLPWIAEQPWVDELYADMRTLAGQLKSANGHRADRPMTRCVLPTDDGLCGGDVWEQDVSEIVTYADGARWRMDVPGGPAACDSCGATWATPEDKARLKLMIEQEHDERTRPRAEDGRRMLTAKELVAKGYVSTVSNVRTQAHRRGVAAVNGYYDPDVFIDKATA